MTKQPLIDVLIPHYNDYKGLALSLRSVEAQEWSRFRVVVADDGSSPNVISELEKLLDNLKFETVLIRHASNRGRPQMRNALLKAIESDYVAWLDAGDEWYPQKTATQMETLLGAMDRGQTVWVTCDYDWQWAGQKPIACLQRTKLDQTRAMFEGRELRGYLWTLIARADTFREVGPFDENLPRLQDLDYFLRFIEGGGTIVKPDNAQSLCIYHKSDAGRDARMIRDCGLYIYGKHAEALNRYGPSFVNSCHFELELLAARYFANNGQFSQAAGRYAAAFARQPRTLVYRVIHRIVRRFSR